MVRSFTRATRQWPRIAAALGILGTACGCSALVDVDPLDQPDAADMAAEPADANGGWPRDAATEDDGGNDGAAHRDATTDAGAADTGAADARTDRDASDASDASRGSDARDAMPESGDAQADGSTGGADASDAGPLDASSLDAADASTLATGLVALYHFDETSGTTAHDSSGNGNDATLSGGATFAAGVTNGAVSLDGSSQFVALPANITNGLTSFSASAWVFLNAAPDFIRVFDFGSGTTRYMFLSPHIPGTRFAITTRGASNEHQTSGTALPTGSWQHVAVTLTGTTATLYINGVQAAQNTTTTITPADLGTTTQNWLGRSQFTSDPFLSGKIDEFRLYGRALSGTEITALFDGKE